MLGGIGWVAVACLVFAGAAPVEASVPQPAGSTGSPDAFEANTLNDTSGGVEVPYVSSAVRQFDSGTFNTSAYTVEGTEDASSSSLNLNGCLEGGSALYAGRTAWFRFNPGVDGTISVLAGTPGYDSVLFLREAREAAWGTTTFSDVRGRDFDCSDVADGAGDEQIAGYAAKAGSVYYVQVGGKCPLSGGVSTPTTCRDDAVPGGATTIRLTFTPSDSDGDGVPDTADQCPGQGVAGSVNAVGCPDRDHDGVADASDACPDLAGVASSDAYNGCPAGPRPPRGERAEVVVVSTSGDPLNTSSVDVLLKLDWRQGTRRVLVDNGSGQAPVAVDFASGMVPWRLDPATKSETRQVKVQFLGPGIDDRDSDTITLDVTAPTVPRSVVLPPSGGDYTVGFKVTDGKVGSGVRSVTLLDKSRHRISRSVKCKQDCQSVLRSLSARKRPSFLQVVDHVGNARDVKLPAVDRARCRVQVLSTVDYGSSRCFPIGSSCSSADTSTFDFSARHIACRNGTVVRTRS
jgi:hypothetical protein